MPTAGPVSALDVLPGDVGKARRGQPARHLTDHAHDVGEPEHGHDYRRAADDDELARHPGGHASQQEQDHQRAEAEQQRIHVDHRQPVGDAADRRLEGGRLHPGEPEEVRELRGDDHEGDRRGEPDQHRAGQVVGDEAQMQHVGAGIAATISASSAASAVARPTSPPASGAIAAAVRIELSMSGPPAPGGSCPPPRRPVPPPPRRRGRRSAEAREFGVGEPARHRRGPDGQARRHIAAQAGAVVAPQRPRRGIHRSSAVGSCASSGSGPSSRRD